MTRIVLAPLGFSLFLATSAIAQVKITVSARHHRVQEEIHAKVENRGSRPITFCVEVGQTSPNGDEIESTPTPFWVQQNSNGKWGTLLIGPDVGSNRAAVVLEARESKEFPFRLNTSGKMRLRLNYWSGSIPNLDCHTSPKGRKLATSATFAIE